MEKLNSNDNSCICEYCFIVNKISEAQFFINRFNLKPKKKYNLFPIFSNQKKDIWLAINQDKIPSSVTPVSDLIDLISIIHSWATFPFDPLYKIGK